MRTQALVPRNAPHHLPHCPQTRRVSQGDFWPELFLLRATPPKRDVSSQCRMTSFPLSHQQANRPSRTGPASYGDSPSTFSSPATSLCFVPAKGVKTPTYTRLQRNVPSDIDSAGVWEAMNPQERIWLSTSTAGSTPDPRAPQMVGWEEGWAWPIFFKVVFLPGLAHNILFSKLPQFSLFQLEENGS